jgi:F-type H+-transporting ATPase subunit delta
VSESTQHETTLDIGAEQLGKTYARALLGATSKANVADEVLAQLREIVEEQLQRSPQLAAAFSSLRITSDEKIRVIDRLFGSSVHQHLLRLMKVMAKRGRLGYLASVSRAADAIRDEEMGRAVAEIRTAVPLTDKLRSEVAERLTQTLGKQVRLKEAVDASLVGGMVIRVGDVVYDSSVASRLEKISRAAQAGFARQLIEKANRFASGD